MLNSASWADGLAIVESNRTLVEGESVGYVPFTERLNRAARCE